MLLVLNLPDLQGNEQINVGAGAVTTRLMKGRGAYGGASDVRGHSKNDANPLRIKSSTSSLLWKVSCSLCVLVTGF